MRDEMRATRLAVLTGAAALLGACASQNIQSSGGDVFVLQSQSLSGSRAVERGLADARDFCDANGRQLVVQDSRIGSGTYQLQFRCVAPYGAARAGGVDPLLAAAATPPVAAVTDTPAPRRRRARSTQAAVAPVTDATVTPAETPRPVHRTRRARPADAAYVAPADAPLASTAALAPIPQSTLPARFARPEPNIEQPALPPVTTTPLFNPRGASLAAPAAPATRAIPADNGPFTPFAQTAPAAAQPAVAQPVAAQPVAAQPVAARPMAAPSDTLPPIQLPPAAVSTPSGAVMAAPAAGYGASVPSPQALPGASSALTPIASPVRPVPAATPMVNPNTPPQGFFSGPSR